MFRRNIMELLWPSPGMAQNKGNLGTIGLEGEKVACEFVISRGYSIIERNYRNKWGEIDIVAQKNGRLAFFEVKTVSHEISDDTARPEDRVNQDKLSKLRRIIRSYLLHTRGTEEIEFDFYVLAVHLEKESKKAAVRVIKDII